ncbi:MAG: Mor transcription activator family protein [Pseudomonadota bacterium]|jgi:Mor family transcriptional regulator
MLRPEELPEGAQIILDALTRSLRDVLGLEGEAAEQAAYEALRLVLEDCGGEYLYIPKDIRLAAHSRDVQIWRDFNGRNQRELARAYGITPQYVYRIIAAQRAQETRSRQGVLALD